MTASESSPEQQLRSAQLDELRLKNEKLTLELHELRKGKPWYQTLIQFVPVLTAFIAIAGFWWGLKRYQDDQRKAQSEQAEQSRREQTAREREFMKPWLESQRDTYQKALSAAGTVVNTENPETRKRAADEFWRLYHAEMIPVETRSVTTAMKAFGACLDGSIVKCSRKDSNDLVHELGTAMRDSMAATAGMTFDEFASHQFKYDVKPVYSPGATE